MARRDGQRVAPVLRASVWVHIDRPRLRRAQLHLLDDGVRVVDPALGTDGRGRPSWFVLDRSNVVGGEVHGDLRFALWTSGGGRTIFDPAAWRDPHRVADHLWDRFGDRVTVAADPAPLPVDHRRTRVVGRPWQVAAWVLGVVAACLLAVAWLLTGGTGGGPGGVVPVAITASLGGLLGMVAWWMLRDARTLRAWDRRIGTVAPPRGRARYAAGRRAGSDA